MKAEKTKVDPIGATPRAPRRVARETSGNRYFRKFKGRIRVVCDVTILHIHIYTVSRKCAHYHERKLLIHNTGEPI